METLKADGYDVTGVVADNKELADVKKVIQTAVDVYGDLDQHVPSVVENGIKENIIHRRLYQYIFCRGGQFTDRRWWQFSSDEHCLSP